jgi:hypothetical protein
MPDHLASSDDLKPVNGSVFHTADNAGVSKQPRRQAPLLVQLLCGVKAWVQPALPVALASAVRASHPQLNSGSTSRLTGTGVLALKVHLHDNTLH